MFLAHFFLFSLSILCPTNGFSASMLHGQVLFHPLFGCFVGLHDARAERYLRGSETENPIRMISVVELKSKSVQKVCMIQLQNIVRIVGNWWNEIQINDDINMKILYQFYSNYKYTYIFIMYYLPGTLTRPWFFGWKGPLFWWVFQPKNRGQRGSTCNQRLLRGHLKGRPEILFFGPDENTAGRFSIGKRVGKIDGRITKSSELMEKILLWKASWILERSMQGSLSCKLKAKIR